MKANTESASTSVGTYACKYSLITFDVTRIDCG
jgi:hypothetical protein